MGQEFLPIDFANAASKLTKFARKNGYPDWDGDSSELAIVRAAHRLSEHDNLAPDQAHEQVAHAILTRQTQKLIPV